MRPRSDRHRFALARESEVARFRPFRENVRWQANGIAFIGLNVPGPNNHYLTAGGRNGEFEDRSVASTFWLEHAAESARRAELRALVVIIQGDPDFSRYERRDRFSWLRFSHGNRRDGFLEFKRSLVKAAELFRGPVIVIHGSETALPNGFRIDQPLHDDKGAVVANLTRIAMALHKPQAQWLEVQTDFGWRPPFRVRVRDVACARAARPTPVEATALRSPALRTSVEASAPNPAPHFRRGRTSLATTCRRRCRRPRLPPPTPPTSPSQPSLPPILSPPQALPPILPTPASGVPNGA